MQQVSPRSVPERSASPRSRLARVGLGTRLFPGSSGVSWQPSRPGLGWRIGAPGSLVGRTFVTFGFVRQERSMSSQNGPAGTSPVPSTAAAGTCSPGTPAAASIPDQAHALLRRRAGRGGRWRSSSPVPPAWSPSRRSALVSAAPPWPRPGRRGCWPSGPAPLAAVTALAPGPVAGLAAVACAAVLVAGIAGGTVTASGEEGVLRCLA